MKLQDTEGWLTTMKHKRSVISITIAALMLVSLCAVCVSTSVSANPPPAPGLHRAICKDHISNISLYKAMTAPYGTGISQ